MPDNGSKMPRSIDLSFLIFEIALDKWVVGQLSVDAVFVLLKELAIQLESC